jgi:hypothetical protein
VAISEYHEQGRGYIRVHCGTIASAMRFDDVCMSYRTTTTTTTTGEFDKQLSETIKRLCEVYDPLTEALVAIIIDDGGGDPMYHLVHI